jgi:hypothetical protein
MNHFLQVFHQKPIDAHVSVNGRGPAKLGGMSAAKVFDGIPAGM